MDSTVKNLIHGGDIYSAKADGLTNILDLSANINPRGLPFKVKKAIIDSLDDCVNYPDPLCRELKEAIGKFEQLNSDTIFCGNGAADVIFRLVLAVKPKKAIVLAPTFAEYEQALDTVECETTHYFLKKEEGFQVKEEFFEFLDQMESSLGESFAHKNIMFLCNPNNPTGQIIEKEFLEKVLDICRNKGILLVLDECFIEFVENWQNYTMKDYIEKNNNLFILKAFTKSYAMPGLRLGYGISANKELLNQMSKMGQPWAVSIPAQIAGVQALKEKEYLEGSMRDIGSERLFLQTEMESLGIKTYKPYANYIFFCILENCDYSVKNFKDKLRKKGIIIRDCSNYHGLKEGYYRAAVKDRTASLRFLAALLEIKNGR